MIRVFVGNEEHGVRSGYGRKMALEGGVRGGARSLVVPRRALHRRPHRRVREMSDAGSGMTDAERGETASEEATEALFELLLGNEDT